MHTTAIFSEMKQKFADKCTNSSEAILKHSANQFYINTYQPDAVFYAEDANDILELTNFCIHHKVPIIPYGGGTSVEGHLAAVNGGVCLNLSRMNQVIEVNCADSYVVVQPGITYHDLNNYLQDYGYHFAVEAGWGATIGGMLSTNASGAGATDAGSMLKNTLSCKVVVYDCNQAKQITVGTTSPKSSAGYHLLNLFIGAEGTLGVLTEITLKIRRNFSYRHSICCQFDNIQDCVQLAIKLKGLVPCRRFELLDKLQTEACIQYSNIPYLKPDKNTILIELAGNQNVVDEEVKLVLDEASRLNAENVKLFPDKVSADQLWMMRKHACPAAIQFIDKNKKAIETDICVPLSKLSACIESCYNHMESLGIKAPLIAHIGDGNFHFTILVNPQDEIESAKAKGFCSTIIAEAIAVGGTCTGEHGIGLGKIIYLEQEHADSLFLMRKLKTMLDPLNIFNPGKIINLV